MLSFEIAAEVPTDVIPIEGNVTPDPASAILLLLKVLLSFPVVVPDPNRMVPAVVEIVAVADPSIVQFVTVFKEASFINWIVDVPAELEVEELENTRELPPVFNPSTVTLRAPLKLIKGPEIFPATVLAPPPAGCMLIEV